MSLKSMTGFGSSRVAKDGLALRCEIRSLNQKTLDLHFRIPRVFNEFEPALREFVFSQLARGRVEIYVSRDVSERSGALELKFNRELYRELSKLYREAASSELSTDLDSSALGIRLLDRREVLEIEEAISDEEFESKLLMQLIKEALEALNSSRVSEGQRLEKDILKRLKVLESSFAELEKSVKSGEKDAAERSRERIQSLLKKNKVEVDEARLEQELIILSERSDVTEELVRLKSHFKFFRATLKEEVCGRKLDFICQEFSRELNTINAKTPAAETKSLSLSMRAELEKIREQLQNIE